MTDRARLSAFDIACVVVGGIVGVGIFFTPAEVARRVDSPAQLVTAWALGGVVAALGALVFAELACRLPGHGGTWRYVRAAFGPRTALLFAWANGFVIQAGALGVIGLVLAEHLEILVGRAGDGQPSSRLAVAAGSVLGLAALNATGLRAGRVAQNLFTVAKGLALAGLVVLSLSAAFVDDGATADTANPTHATAHDASTAGDLDAEPFDAPTEAPRASAPTTPPRAPRGWLLALAAAMLPVLFAIGGWQHGTFVAGAARDPLRDVPLGIVGGVAFVIVAYLAVNGSLLALLGMDGMAASQAVATDAARAGLARWGLGDAAARVLAGAVVVSSVGVLNTICLAPPYVLSSMAAEGLLPRGLAAGRGAPVVAILVQAGAGVALLLGVGALYDGDPISVLGFLLDGVVFVDWLFYGLCGLALLRLQRVDASAPAGSGAAGDPLTHSGSGEPGGSLAPIGFRAPGGPLVPAAFAAAAAVVAVGAIVISPLASLSGAAVCALGLVVHRFATGRTPAA